jgi:outer membrane lipoprotein-sorting protein
MTWANLLWTGRFTGLGTVSKAIACSALALVFATGCGGSSKKGFLDPPNLEQAIEQQTDDALAHPSGMSGREASGIPEGTTVSEVICVKSAESPRKFDCRINFSSGDGETLKVIVSEDGKNWVLASASP